MAGQSSVLSDGSRLSRVDRALYRIERVMTVLGGLAIFALMLLAVWNVTGRNGFDKPMSGYVDWINQAMPLIAFLGISFCQRDGGHIRMDILVGRLRGRVLWAFEFLSTLCMLVLILLLIWGSWEHFGRSFDFAAPRWSRDSSIDIGLPLWPGKLLVPVAFSVLALRLVIQMLGFGRAFLSGATNPVAVPLVQDAATVAAQEAAAVSRQGGT